MKIGSVILGFAMICIGIVDLAGQAPVLGIHPAVWFILGALLICSDSAWAKLANPAPYDRPAKLRTNFAPCPYACLTSLPYRTSACQQHALI